MISVRDLQLEDIPHVLNYWFHSPPGFIEGMAVDVMKLPSEIEMRDSLTAKCKSNSLLTKSKSNALAILKDSEAIGFHTLWPFTEGVDGIFHSHIWNPQMRGKGVALVSYLLAAQEFIKRFDLQKILYKTPMQNIGAIRVKQKLGIRELGEESVDFGIVKSGTLARVFELTREELKKKLIQKSR